MPANYNEKFKAAFEGFENYYVIIGGTATSFILDAHELESRTTKDYDMVVLKRDSQFYEILTTFLAEGDYLPHLSSNEQLYRFTTANEEYPKMIELFSKEPFPLVGEGRLTPLPFDTDMSMSALLLDTDYYELLIEGRQLLNGYSILSDKYLIIFKAKAWLDLKRRREQGERVDSQTIKKHLNDIARLLGALPDIKQIDVSESIQNDLSDFLVVLEANIDLIPQNTAIIFTKEEILANLTELLTKRN